MLQILRLQVATGRTSAGRDFGGGLVPAVENILRDPGISEIRMMECWNCQFVLDEEHFAGGCPAGGCKDFGETGASSTEVAKED